MSTQAQKSFVIQYEVNDACNLRCSHCYHGQKAIKTNPISLQRLLEDIESLKADLGDAYKINLVLSGGETFVHPDLMKMLIQTMKAGYATVVLTNGTLLTPENAFELILTGVKQLSISLDGPDAEIHDAIRGQGMFDKTLNGIRDAQQEGLWVKISYTLMQNHNDSPEQLRALFELARREKFSSINIFRMFLHGDGVNTPQYSYTDGKRFKAVLELLYDLAQEYPDVLLVIKDPLAKNLERAQPDNVYIDVCCYIKKDYLSVAATGKVYACRKLEMPIGNLFEDTLSNIWKNNQLLDKLDNRREYMEGKCRTCPINTECRGGCLAASYGESGRLFVPDPACWKEEVPAVMM